MFPWSQFLSVNQRFVGLQANNFWQYDEHSFRRANKFVKIWLFIYVTTKLILLANLHFDWAHTDSFLDFPLFTTWQLPIFLTHAGSPKPKETLQLIYFYTWFGMKFRAHKRSFTASGTISGILRNFGTYRLAKNLEKT